MKILKCFFLLLCFSMMEIFSCSIAMAGINVNSIESKSAFLIDKKAVSKQIEILRQQYHIPGIAIAVVSPEGTIWQQGFGVTRKGGNQAVTPMTLFSIESQTKMFTTLGVMRAVQSGLLDLNTPISNYLPNLTVYSVFQNNPAKLITLKNLLSHTAGFPHEAPIGNNFNSSPSFAEHMQSILKGLWLQFPVGNGYNYSNVGMDLAGYILQVESKMSYEAYMQEQVLNPLKMRRSTFNIIAFQNDANHAEGFIPGLSQVPINHSMIPAGGLYSDAIDMSHYLEFQLNQGIYQGQTVINQHLLQTMLIIPFPSPAQVDGNALGIWKGTRLNTVYYTHLGRGFGYSSDLEWYPQYDIGVVVLMNQYDTNNVDINIAHLLVDPIIQAKFNEEKGAIENGMIGEYLSNGGSITLMKDPKTHNLILTGTINEGPTGNNVITSAYYPLTYLGNNLFISTALNEQYRFIRYGVTGVKTLQRISDGYRWFFNDVPGKFQEEQIKINKDCQEWLGVYDLYGYGPVEHFNVHEVNGNLYINTIRLIQKNKNIFITPNGQVLIFTAHQLNWAGLNLYKESLLTK